MSTELAIIPMPGGGSLEAAIIDGSPMVALRPLCDVLGLDHSVQLKKLKTRSWATVVQTDMVAADGKRREMSVIDRRTLTMWLATIHEGRVAPEIRDRIVYYQREATDALDAYFHEGGAINPNATRDQLEVIADRATAQAKLIAAFKGIIDPKHLEAKARVVLARGLGETPEIDPADVPLYVSDYLKSKGLANDMISAKSSGFGKRVKGLFLAERGETPRKAFQELPNGTVREVNAYTQADLPLFDEVWNRYYEGVTKAAGGAA